MNAAAPKQASMEQASETRMSHLCSTVIEPLRSLPLRIGRVFLTTLVLAACSRGKAPPGPEQSAPAPVSATKPSPSALETEAAHGWFEDDYPAALAAARARTVPLFVDASA